MSEQPPYKIIPFAGGLNRNTFDCGDSVLNSYLTYYAAQDIKRLATACYVAVTGKEFFVAGYYTLSAASITLDKIPALQAKKFARYPEVPAALIGRLAVDRRHQGKKLGEALLWDAIMRASRADLAITTMLVEAKDTKAAAYYQRFGFIPLLDLPLKLFLPLKNLLKS